jgi:hypothetical protein
MSRPGKRHHDHWRPRAVASADHPAADLADDARERDFHTRNGHPLRSVLAQSIPISNITLARQAIAAVTDDAFIATPGYCMLTWDTDHCDGKPSFEVIPDWRICRGNALNITLCHHSPPSPKPDGDGMTLDTWDIVGHDGRLVEALVGLVRHAGLDPPRRGPVPTLPRSEALRYGAMTSLSWVVLYDLPGARRPATYYPESPFRVVPW